jgi:hypothetical protein
MSEADKPGTDRGGHYNDSPFPLKRYVVVRWDAYYPDGDLRNIRGSYSTVKSALASLVNPWGYDFTKIYDSKNGKVIHADPELESRRDSGNAR